MSTKIGKDQTTSTAGAGRLLGGLGGQPPRLFLHGPDAVERVRERLAPDPLLGGFWQALLGGARLLIDAPPPARELVGTYPTMLTVSRQYLRRVCLLGFAFLMTREARYLRAAEAHMLAASEMSDWCPRHCLDTAEMTAAVATGYSWLHDELPAATRDRVAQAIVGKGLKPSFEYATEGPRVIAEGTWPVRGDNNWAQVCHAGLVMGALAVADREPDLAERVIARALTHIPHTMRAVYTPCGNYSEGPMYWGYGTTFNVMLIDALKAVSDDGFGLDEIGGFCKTADYQQHMTAPTGRYFNYSDCREHAALEPAMFWFAAQRREPSLLWAERAKIESCLKAPDAELTQRLLRSRLLPLALIWSPPLSDVAPRRGGHWRGEGRNPVAVHRSGWERESVYVGLKGGRPSCPHGHMDIGSFVLEAQGVRWAIDPGLEEYENLGLGIWETGQNSDRWRVPRLNNLSHSTLVVNGAHQRVDGHAPICSFAGSDAATPHTIIDMAEVYADQLAAARRGVALVDGRAVVVADELAATDRPAAVRWAFVTQAAIDIRSDRQAVLRQDGKTLDVRVLAPAGVALERYDATFTPADGGDAAMLGFTLTLQAHQRERLAVVFLPQGTQATTDELLERCRNISWEL